MKKALKRVLSTVLSSVMVLSCVAVTNVTSVLASTYTYTPSASSDTLYTGDSFTSISGILTTAIAAPSATFSDGAIRFSYSNTSANLVADGTTTTGTNVRLFIEATPSKTGELTFTTSIGTSGRDIYILEKTGTGDTTADKTENPEKYYDTYTAIAHETIGSGSSTTISGEVTKGVTYYYASKATTPNATEISFTEAFGTYTFSGDYGSGNSYTDSFTLTDEDNNSYTAEYSATSGGYVLTISDIYADTYAKGDTFTVTAPTGFTASTDVLTVDTITASGSTAKGYTYTASFVESLAFAPISYTTDYTFTGSTADNEYTGNVTLTNSAKAISLSIPVTAGESSFSSDKTLSNDLVFEEGDEYTVSISASGYTSAGSSTLTIDSITAGSSSSDPTLVSFDGTICYLKDEFDYSVSAGLTVDGQSEFSSDSYSFGDFTLTKDGTDYTASVSAVAGSDSGVVYVLEADFTAARNTISAGDTFTLTVPSGYDGPDTVTVESVTETSLGVYDVVLEDIALETHITYTYKPSANEMSHSYSSGSTVGGIDTTYLDIKPASDTKVKVYYSGSYYFSVESSTIDSDMILNGRYTTATGLRVLYAITPQITGDLTVTTNSSYTDEGDDGYIAVLNSDGSYTVLGVIRGSSSNYEKNVTASVEAGTTYYFISAGSIPDLYSVTIDQADLTTKAYTLTGSLGSDNEYDGDFAVTGSDSCYYTATAYKDSGYYTINAAAALNGGLDGSEFSIDYSDFYTAEPETVTAAYDDSADSYTLTSGLVIKEAFSGTYTYNPEVTDTVYSAGSALPTNTDYLTVVVGVDDTSGYSSAYI
ncbi:MAG: hypothetical protein LUD81_07820 [Clostridiales bacterium]|nr:hypothetical protein [Clostridiales bacterium]